MDEKSGTALAPVPIQQPPEQFFEIDLDRVRRGLTKIRQFQALAKELLIAGKDYGVIPGTQNPTLLKPGAEKITKLMELSDSYEIIERIEDYDKPMFAYTVRCCLRSIHTGNLISQGVGQCNSMEKKYRCRWMFSSELPDGVDHATLKKRRFKSKKTGEMMTQYLFDNDDICSLVNTILKMSKKRALVDAALSAGRLSDMFGQDFDDVEIEYLTDRAGDAPITTSGEEHISPAQVAELETLRKQVDITEEHLRKWLRETYDVKDIQELPQETFWSIRTMMLERISKRKAQEADKPKRDPFEPEPSE